MATAKKRRKVFISYRREDAADAAGRIRDWLVQTNRIAREDVFMDVETILPGADFVSVIEQAIAQCKALIVVISPSWIAQVNAPTSYVRLETEAALRQNITVIPVLIGGVQMPPAEQLPPGLQKLTRLNAREVRAASFEYDMGWIRKALGFKASTSFRWSVAAVVLLLLLLLTGIFTQVPETQANPLWAAFHAPTATPPPQPTATDVPTATEAPTVFVVTADKFVGQWDGLESSTVVDQAPTLIRIVVAQQGDILQVDIYAQTGGQIPSTPSYSATGTLSGGQVALYTKSYLPDGSLFTSDQWVLTLPDPGTLHFTHHSHYEEPGDTRPDTDSSGDLHH
jgi:hypothetical protein